MAPVKPVLMTRDVLDTLVHGAKDARSVGRERCWHLFADEGIIVAAINPGAIIAHPAMVRPDYDTGDRVLREQLTWRRTLDGEAHVHLGAPSGPSSGDIATLEQLYGTGMPNYFCVVVTVHENQAPTISCHSISTDGDLVEHEVALADAPYHSALPADAHDAHVVIIGAGTGGGNVADHTGHFGVRKITLIDHDRFEPHNMQRHLAPGTACGKKKVVWLAGWLRQHTTAEVCVYPRAITPQNLPWLASVLGDADYVVECTGHPVVRALVGETAKRQGKPAVFGGVFAKAAGGIVFVQSPDAGAACVRCLFPITRTVQPEDNTSIETLTRQYGFTPEELERQVGVYTDVSMVSTLQAKVVLDLLKRTPPATNLFIVSNQTLEIQRAQVRQSTTCTNCNPDLEDSAIPF